jgi:hypothetical protein
LLATPRTYTPKTRAEKILDRSRQIPELKEREGVHINVLNPKPRGGDPRCADCPPVIYATRFLSD